MAFLGRVFAWLDQRFKQSSGLNWYVNGVSGADATGRGKSADESFASIGAALAVANNGDTIFVAAGTYDENGLDIGQNGLSLCCQWGTSLVDTTTGTQTLLVSGNSCLIQHLNIAQAGQIGLKITGANCRYESSVIVASTIAIDIDGPACIMDQVALSGYTTTGVDIASASNLLRDVSANGGDAAVRGVYLSGAGADNNVLRDVFFAGNATAPIEIIAAAQGNTINNCSSGAGDGIRVDDDSGTNVWSNWTFANEIYHTTTFDGSGPATDNLFRVYGTVEIEWIYGDIETVLSNDIGATHLDTDDGTATTAVTKAAGGPDISSYEVGSTVFKTADALIVLTDLRGDQVRFHENTSQKPKASFVLQEKPSVATYLRLNYAGVGTSGVIHWHCRFEPLTENGWLEPA